MKIEIKHDRGKSLLSLQCVENCDNDSSPMVSTVEFRRHQSAPDPQIAAIGACILFARYCGQAVDLGGSRVGIEAARAIRKIVPDVEELYPIDAGRRDISQGVASLVVGEAGQLFGRPFALGQIGRSARVITWSGDFVSADQRSSADHIAGDVFTNAALIAGSTAVSVALALFWGGKGRS